MSQKVYGLYTHENVDIYGWPLSLVVVLMPHQGRCYIPRLYLHRLSPLLLSLPLDWIK